MLYREFGKTGKKISALAFGGMRFKEIKVGDEYFVDEEATIEALRRGYELGINYFDSGYFYCRNRSEKIVGKAIKPFRDKVFLSTKIPMNQVKGQGDYRRWLEHCLKETDTDYIDFFHFWSMRKKDFSEKVVPFNLEKEVQKAKDEGLIKHCSFSFHDTPENLRYIVDNFSYFETALLSYNFLDSSLKEEIAYLSEKGLGVLIMNPVGGGRLAANSEFYKTIGLKSSAMPSYELAFSFVLGTNGVTAALSGMSTKEMVEQNVAAVNNFEKISKEDMKTLTDAAENLREKCNLYCTGCKYCIPCPQKIDIPAIFNLYNLYSVYNLKDEAKREYEKIKRKGATASDCIKCGICESKCTQKISIIEELEKIDNILG